MKCIKIQWLSVAVVCCIFILSACTKDSIGTGTPSLENTTIWAGPTITFTKANGADPTQPANQDQITDLVWITRGNTEGGQIFNAVSETNSNKDNSPAGTLWAEGTTADLTNLTFGNFRATVDKPKNAVGKDLVLLLVEENIAIDIKFTSWSQNRQGGFAYERSSN
ncbi:MAG: hypothetical protein AAFZ63_20015 [Bacteroidota bacterium]